ncbi:hypothetical protein [Aliiroseovarius sp. YM-037]|uniref:hypothetical protein n=1 Tax=Aliiroseovarius sp. YM-037 TaxID=3341728 RepID=UPI003A7FBB42
MQTLRYQTTGRNRRTLLVLATVYLLFLLAFIWLDAAWWIILFLALFTLPALWDVVSNRASGLTLSDETISWTSGRYSGEVQVADLEKVRFDTRLDFSVRVTLLMRDETKVRLPYDALPPHRGLEAAMNDMGIKTERHHFALL